MEKTFSTILVVVVCWLSKTDINWKQNSNPDIVEQKKNISSTTTTKQITFVQFCCVNNNNNLDIMSIYKRKFIRFSFCFQETKTKIWWCNVYIVVVVIGLIESTISVMNIFHDPKENMSESKWKNIEKTKKNDT